jgi:pyrimidine deaminase RibD-like protein
MKKPNGKPTPKALALRRWNCESIEQMAQMIAEGEQMIAEIKKGAKDSNGFTKCWPGKHAEGTKKGKNGGQVRNCVPNESQGVAEGGGAQQAAIAIAKKASGKYTKDGSRKKMRLKEFDISHETDDSSTTLNHHRGDYEIRNYHKLDKYLSELCDLVEKGQASGNDFGMVAAGILTLKHPYMARLNRPGKDGRTHAEHAVIEDFIKKYGSIPEGSVIITTLSPCNTPMDERDGPSCADLLNKHGIQKVYCGYIDPTQHDGAEDQREYNLVETMNKELRTRCEAFADTFLDKVHENLMGFLAKPVKKKTTTSAEEMRKYFEKEKAKEPDKIERGEINKKAQQVYTKRDENFADGRHPEDKGDSARLGIPKHASISSLRKIGHGSGRKAQLARWQANMRSGRNK